uniref:Uncharacterized protein n=1 Tax=Cyclophora tenuis TaxID=216820 RepID=A0A7S1D3U9_CYCTE
MFPFFLVVSCTILVNVWLAANFALYPSLDGKSQVKMMFDSSWMISSLNEQQHGPGQERTTCPAIPISNCSYWSFDIPQGQKGTWVWNNSCAFHGQVLRVPRTSPKAPRRFDEITRNRTTVVFFGSSHIRELYLALIRLHRGLDFMAQLERNATYVMNGIWSPRCDPLRTGFLNGSYGVDLDACKEPTKKMVIELGGGGTKKGNVAIGFKTFLHTPDADDLMVDFLERHRHVRHPRVLITDVGVWGPRGRRMAGSANTIMTPEQELDYNLQWYRKTFPHKERTKILMIVEHESYYERVGLGGGMVRERLLEFARNDPDTILLRKDWIMQDLDPKMRCTHGCAGPVMVVVAHLVLDWLKAATRKCLYQKRHNHNRHHNHQ